MNIPVHEQFTNQQKEQIKQLWKNGKTQKEIGEIFGVPRRTIMKLCEHLDLKRNHKEAQKSKFDEKFVEEVKNLRLKGTTMEKIAEITNRSTSAVNRVCKKFNIKCSIKDFDETKICNDYIDGGTLKGIAKSNNTTDYIIRQILVKNNIKIRKPIISGGAKIKITDINLPEFEDTKEWWEDAYIKYGMSSISKFLDRSVGYVNNKLRKHNINTQTISERCAILDKDSVVKAYSVLGSMLKVAKRFNCTITSVKNILESKNIAIAPTSEMFSGSGNPFYGKEHTEENRRKYATIGAHHGRKFWQDNPEYIEIVREKQKEIWSDLEKRHRDSLMVAELRRQGKCNSHKGEYNSRFGVIPFDSSYELLFIENCEKDKRIVNLERDFDLVEYDYDGKRHFVPDFMIWLKNGDFLIVEIKSEWYSKKPKERSKIITAYGVFADKFMVVEKDFSEVDHRIDLCFNPVDFKFEDIELKEIKKDDYSRFYASFHYLGHNSRSGFTLGAYITGKLIATCTIAGITRNEIAKKQNCSPNEIRGLVRFCIHPDYHKKNFSSWFLSRVIKYYKKNNENVKMLVSFADMNHGHSGTIYEASGWKYDGESSKSYSYIDSNDNSIHKKTVYDRAKRECLSESEYVNKMGYKRIWDKFNKKRYIKSL